MFVMESPVSAQLIKLFFPTGKLSVAWAAHTDAKHEAFFEIDAEGHVAAVMTTTDHSVIVGRVTLLDTARFVLSSRRESPAVLHEYVGEI